MDIKIYYDGKLSYRNQLAWITKKSAWTTYVWLDCLLRNKRLPRTHDERELAHSIAVSFAHGQRRPF